MPFHRLLLVFFVGFSVGIGLFVSCGGNVPISPVRPPGYGWGKQIKLFGCVATKSLPDKLCTPGDIFQNATTLQICKNGYTNAVRSVSEREKQQVFREYGITAHTPGQYEVDHLVPLELGGSNTLANLWPELASPIPGFHQKDLVENYLHGQVCSGKMNLSQVQVQIATNWLQFYPISVHFG